MNYASISKESRDVAQPGSAPEWGSGGRRFKSAHPDQKSKLKQPLRKGLFLVLGYIWGIFQFRTGKKIYAHIFGYVNGCGGP